jgi:hypothetical protein
LYYEKSYVPAEKNDAKDFGGHQMDYKTRAYPLFSACGLNCGLCPRYHTSGTSRCPGCAGEGFSAVHPSCGVLSCCQRKEIEYCFECVEYPCKRYDNVDLYDSFITHKNQIRDLEKAKKIGMEAYKTEQTEKLSILEILLSDFDDGRRKSYFCLAVNLLDIQDLRIVIEKAAGMSDKTTLIKEKTKTIVGLLEKMAARQGITLKLQKKA